MENNSNEQNDRKPTTSTEITNPTEPAQSETSKESSYAFNEKTIMASLSYVGPLVLIPFLTKKDDPFVMFHVRQGLVLFGIEVILMFINMLTFYMLSPIVAVINIILVILSIIGILNALKLKEKQVPMTGRWAEKIKI